VANAYSLPTVAHAGFSAKRLAHKRNHRSKVGREYWEEGPFFRYDLIGNDFAIANNGFMVSTLNNPKIAYCRQRGSAVCEEVMNINRKERLN